jgi:glycine cleavage system H protein
MYPEDLKYSKTHEWARVEDDLVTVGLTSFALDHLQDLVFLELPETETEVEAGESFGQIESVKAVSDINAPVTGQVVEVNEELVDELETMKESPYDQGWLVKIKVTDPAGLEDMMDAAAYGKHCEEEDA